ncbi:MAG: hypothetical protein VYC62_06675 [Verrucomicrobiota bacterium]|nr:hypothetical protein [Litorivicinus sp.]MEC8118467.1 hypothetical protein [Actinomycetota bacterium]MEE2615262.1 hypothetical protein [Verrucomicrobiota bacterium]
MHTTSDLDAEIARTVEDIYTPDADDRQRFPSDLVVKADSFQEVVDEVGKDMASPRQGKYAANHREHLSNILLNLARSIVTRRWTIFFGDSKTYSKGGLMHSAGFTSRSRTSKILETLVASEAIRRVDGANYQEKPHGNLYYPNRELREKLFPYGLESTSERSFDKVLVRINNPSRGWGNFDLTTVDDYHQMAEINEYAKAQTWACKEAITRIFKYDPFTSGRLHTEFQNLPARSKKIRQNTLINGEPIREVDFNANHLRLFLAFNKLDVYGNGTDAYREIANLARVDRQTVKSFFKAALNCESYERARSEARVPDKFGRDIMEAFERLYPRAHIFNGEKPFGLVGMQLEGEILQIAMRQLRLLDVFALPIHDAIAVNEKNYELAKLAMEDAWLHVMHPFHPTAKTFVG